MSETKPRGFDFSKAAETYRIEFDDFQVNEDGSSEAITLAHVFRKPTGAEFDKYDQMSFKPGRNKMEMRAANNYLFKIAVLGVENYQGIPGTDPDTGKVADLERVKQFFMTDDRAQDHVQRSVIGLIAATRMSGDLQKN